MPTIIGSVRLPAAGLTMIDRQRHCGEDGGVTTAPATMQRPTEMQSAKRTEEESGNAEAAMLRSGA
jgi:hypothetical protein